LQQACSSSLHVAQHQLLQPPTALLLLLPQLGVGLQLAQQVAVVLLL
jgi:hypothetical protein